MTPMVVPCPGVCTFAEDPSRAAPEACLIWHAERDPGTLPVAALPIDFNHVDRFDPERFGRWFALVTDRQGGEHAVLSDGFRHIRIDVEEGSLAAGHPVLLRYQLAGSVGIGTEARILPLRRLVGLFRTGRFLPSLFPPDRRIGRWLTVLRVQDALDSGASQRDIAAALFGSERIPTDWRAASDSLRSRVRRMIREARRMAGGGYRSLLERDPADYPGRDEPVGSGIVASRLPSQCRPGLLGGQRGAGPGAGVSDAP